MRDSIIIWARRPLYWARSDHICPKWERIVMLRACERKKTSQFGKKLFGILFTPYIIMMHIQSNLYLCRVSVDTSELQEYRSCKYRMWRSVQNLLVINGLCSCKFFQPHVELCVITGCNRLQLVATDGGFAISGLGY